MRLGFSRIGYFTERQEPIELPSSVDEEEREKIDSFLGLLEDSGVGPIILSAVKSGTAKGGRPAGKLEGPRGDGAAEIQEAIAQKAIQERGEDLGQDGCLPQGKR